MIMIGRRVARGIRHSCVLVVPAVSAWSLLPGPSGPVANRPDGPVRHPALELQRTSCPPPKTPAGLCAGEGDCPPGVDACACGAVSELCCGPGFCFANRAGACRQESCPFGVGRHLDDTCACDSPNEAVYDPCRPGYMLACKRATP